MRISSVTFRTALFGAALLAGLAVGARSMADDAAGAAIKQVAWRTLPNVPGKSVTAIVRQLRAGRQIG